MDETKLEKTSTVQDKAIWRALSVSGVKSVASVADSIHPDLPERDEVFAERIQLFPEGCLGLSESTSNDLCGYVISHPIRRLQPPALNSLLGEIASDANQYYIHDLAILPKVRGHGSARECMDKLSAIARRYPTTCLISVYGTEQFWSRFGFSPVQINDVLEKKLREYGDDAICLERKNEG
ncbi:MAG: hypothetical protein OHK93_004402 [Ramalina farinacea]|uniref:N-acetyltransferase domain-containing protein n=1 Tax=Ramalina farinacea TaxID=258253 RepID=A0AA43QYH5_9LECA|nr:hypothetical protein [Ramalina farinacea]